MSETTQTTPEETKAPIATIQPDTDAETTADVPFEIPEGYRLMSDEEAEALANSLIEDQREKWEIQEIVDNAVAAGQMNDMMRNEFLYEFKQGNRVVRGLSASMISHLAAAQSISEVTDERVHKETEGEEGIHDFEIVVEMPDPHSPGRMLKRTGFCEEPKYAFNRYDKFAKQKAYTKAFRNACMKLLPQDLITSTIYRLAKLVPVDWQPKAQAAPKQSAVNKAMRRCFAVYGKHAEDISEKHSVSREAFGDAIREHYKVKSRKELTAVQWNEIRESLETEGYGDVVKSIIDIAKDSIPF